MKKRLLFLAVVGSALVVGWWALPAAASSAPSGERLVGGTAAKGGSVVEPVYDDMTGQIRPAISHGYLGPCERALLGSG